MEYSKDSLNLQGLGRLAGLSDKLKNLNCRAGNFGLIIFAGDNGISQENISHYTPMSSGAIVKMHLDGASPTSVLLNKFNKPEFIVDVGLYSEINDKRVRDNNIRRGTNNFLQGDALDNIEVLRAIDAGRLFWDEIYNQGFDIIGVGEIGVGDTLCAACLAAVMTGVSPGALTPRGSSSHKVINRKNDIIGRALNERCPDSNSIIDMLCRFGGLEIAALTGFMLEAGKRKIPVMLDGYVTAVAALLAVQSDNDIIDYLIAPNLSYNRGHSVILEKLGLQPIFDLDINYGEGLVSVLGMFIAQIAVEICKDIRVFDNI